MNKKIIAINVSRLRSNSKYLATRYTTVFFTGNIPHSMILSEEMPLYVLPIIKLAKTTNSSLMFIERGAYPRRLAVEAIFEMIGNQGVKVYSEKLAQGSRIISAKEEIAKNIERFVVRNSHEQDGKIAGLSGEDIMFYKRWFAGLPQDVQDSLTLNRLDSENITGLTKIKLLGELVKTEKLSFLDTIQEVVYATRPDLPNSVMYKVKKKGQTVSLNLDDLGGQNNPLARFLLNEIKSKIQTDITSENIERFWLVLVDAVRRYGIEKLESLQLETVGITRYLLLSKGIDLNNVIYCDDGIGTGNSFFKTAVFHKFISAGEFSYNVVCDNRENVVSLGQSCVSDVLSFPEDVQEMFDFYYEGFSRKRYSDSCISKTKAQEESLNELNRAIDEFINFYPSISKGLVEIFNKRSNVEFKNNKEEGFRLLMYMAMEPGCQINREMVQAIGHTFLVSEVELFSKSLISNPEFKQLVSKYEQIKDVVVGDNAERLMERHTVFLKKLRHLSWIYTDLSSSINDYIKNENMASNVSTNDPDFVNVLREFYALLASVEPTQQGY